MREAGFAGVVAILIGLIGLGENDINIIKPKRDFGPGIVEKPVCNVPMSLRQRNWIGAGNSGSCYHASWMTALRWQGQDQWADWWGKHYSGGENYQEMAQRLNNAGLNWAGTCGQQNVKFLEWAHRTRRGAVVAWSPRHIVFLAHFDDKWAGVLDNNATDHIKWFPREEFLQDWISRGSIAMTPMYTPPPPLGS